MESDTLHRSLREFSANGDHVDKIRQYSTNMDDRFKGFKHVVICQQFGPQILTLVYELSPQVLFMRVFSAFEGLAAMSGKFPTDIGRASYPE